MNIKVLAVTVLQVMVFLLLAIVTILALNWCLGKLGFLCAIPALVVCLVLLGAFWYMQNSETES